jgi:hypothetical protein
MLFCTYLAAQNFMIPKSVLDAAGGTNASTNFEAVTAVGQAAPIGPSQSTNFRLAGGYLAGGRGFNLAPVLTQVPDQQMDEGETLDVPILASDPNNNQIILSVENLPAFGSFTDNGDGTGNVRFTPSLQNSGVYSGIKVTASDNGFPVLSDSTVFTLTVMDVVGIGDPGSEIPTTFAVMQNYPNPFNPETTIKYQLPQVAEVQLIIYNVLGQTIRTLVNDRIEAGYYEVVWDGRNDSGIQVPSGVYIYRFEAADYQKVNNMILLK